MRDPSALRENRVPREIKAFRGAKEKAALKVIGESKARVNVVSRVSRVSRVFGVDRDLLGQYL